MLASPTSVVCSLLGLPARLEKLKMETDTSKSGASAKDACRALLLFLFLRFQCHLHLLEGDPYGGQRPFGVGGKELERRERTSKVVLSRLVEHWASPSPVFYGLRPLFAKGAQCVKEIDVQFQRYQLMPEQ